MPLMLGYRSVALQFLRVDYRQIEAGLCAVIKKNGIEHFPSRIGKPKRNVADPQQGLNVRDLLLDQSHTFDGLDRASDIVRVTGRARKNKRIDNYILDANTVVLGEQLYRSNRY